MDPQVIISAFKTLDIEGKGYLKADDLRRLMTSYGERMTDEQVDEMIKDAGGGDKIDYEKFVKAFSAKAVEED